jgi:hypothetical protein
VIYADWAAALLQRGQPAAARVLLARARPLSPREERLRILGELARG